MAKKKLCKWKRERIEDRFDKLRAIVESPQFACAKCARVARAREYLCKPRALR